MNTIQSLESFELDKKRFLGWGDGIMVKRCGGSREIYLIGSNGEPRRVKTRYFDLSNKKKGMHICWMVRKDIENRIKSGEYPLKFDEEFAKYTLKIYDKSGKFKLKVYDEKYTPPTIFYNSENIEKHLNKHCIALDISSCYYTTARNIGAISQRVYEMGNKKDREWKEARNTSIGALGKRTSWETHIPGQPVKTLTTRDNLWPVRIEVIDKVAEIAKEVFAECYSGWMMFLTDCFYLLPDQVPKAKKILEKYGYSTKHKTVMFNKLVSKGIVVDEVGWEDILSPAQAKKALAKAKAQAALPPAMRSKKKDDHDHYHFFNSIKNQFILK